ncbi:dTDP-4-dehydrorhamnose 3,5-epimerase [Craterilacuibacter sp. RT1T]|uniref:dTDP-4-dehydrorhamnose 3,5-epimerase n=1 Tax=Craterilacuibacter sp. RT1T TaxID=2942211 RepID=UPI0020BF7F47|nr:dTDP-4-dehydrorhamnose 3,5-epimerase [Craterilacuibacter sp. RT1T]MCL6263682.1 dTDP-4-dehydrorhamnose 3,5-epimerase [Craterilacuibacter sp. RT1T]
MKVTSLAIADVKLIEPRVFGDERGFFFESFNHAQFEQAIGRPVSFVQDNHSHSVKNVLRGLHYQSLPYSQGKLVRCVVGAVFDVAVDIRQESPTFGRWVSAVLSADNKRQLWIPEGFAHGFLTLSDSAELLYKATSYYMPQSESCINWSDVNLAIDWPLENKPIVSARDKQGHDFSWFGSGL